MNKDDLVGNTNEMPVTLYDKLGGRDAITAVVDRFYKLIMEDAEVSAYFQNTDMKKLAEHQTVFVSFALGGPDYYTGRSLTESHEGLHITGKHFDIVLGYLEESLRQSGVGEPDIQEVVGNLRPLKSRIVEQER